MNRFKLNISIGQYACFAICLMLMLIIPIVHDHKLIGYELKSNEGSEPETITVADGETVLVNTTAIGKDIIGYVGPTPVEITVKDGIITQVRALPNKETPEFFGAVKNSDLLDSYNGLTLQQAAGKNIDAVSGATFTSNAIIRNMKAGVNYALKESPVSENSEGGAEIDFKWYATIFIILCGALLPFVFKNKKYRYIQLALNVIILGFWGGAFISYSIMVSVLANGVMRVVMIPVVLMLVVAFIYPMFGKIDHYCNWICPYGSIQELAGKCFKKKIRISPAAAKNLVIFRQVLWFILMWLLWTGLWFDWMGYEPFAAFFFLDASPAVLAIAGAFIILSLFVQRPYCRFVCPTGSLFKFSEGRN